MSLKEEEKEEEEVEEAEEEDHQVPMVKSVKRRPALKGKKVLQNISLSNAPRSLKQNAVTAQQLLTAYHFQTVHQSMLPMLFSKKQGR